VRDDPRKRVSPKAGLGENLDADGDLLDLSVGETVAGLVGGKVACAIRASTSGS
jgi:hypothetical protein